MKKEKAPKPAKKKTVQVRLADLESRMDKVESHTGLTGEKGEQGERGEKGEKGEKGGFSVFKD